MSDTTKTNRYIAPTEYVDREKFTDADALLLKKIRDETNETCAKLMGFKKVHWFMNKLCIQRELDVANNNIPWSPTTNANDAMEIMQKYKFTLKPTVWKDKFAWSAGSEMHFEVDEDPLWAICKTLMHHAVM